MQKKKIKVIRPTLRHKKRYVLLSYDTEKVLDKYKVYKLLDNNFVKNYGLFNSINANIYVVDINFSKKEILVRVNKDFLDYFISSLFFISKDFGVINLKNIQNTIKGLKK